MKCFGWAGGRSVHQILLQRDVPCRKLSIRWERVTLQFHPDEARSEHEESTLKSEIKPNEIKGHEVKVRDWEGWEHWKTCQFCILLDLRNKPIIPSQSSDSHLPNSLEVQAYGRGKGSIYCSVGGGLNV